MDSMKESFSSIMAGIEERMTHFEAELQKGTKNPNSSPSLASLSTEFTAFKAFVVSTVSAFRTQIEFLTREVDSIEMRSRRKMLLLHGVPEEKADDTTQVVMGVFTKNLELNDVTPDDINRCHRMGRPSGTNKPRPILVKLRNVAVRDKVWFSKTRLKGSGITMSEFITRARHQVFMAARERFGVSKCWTREGHIYVLDPDGIRHRVVSLDELNRLDCNTPKTAPAAKVTAKTRRAANIKK